MTIGRRPELSYRRLQNTCQNLGDVLLINGKHQIAFNEVGGNFQQFWADGARQTALPFDANADESFAFHILNMGLHRFYKIHLAFRTTPGGAWTVSNDLVWIGGQDGLLDTARVDDGSYGTYRSRGRKGRNSNGGADGLGAGVDAVQTQSELALGEYLLPTSARISVAFKDQPSWAEVALRVNGFSVIGNQNTTADELPVDMQIARFDVATTADNTFKLTQDLVDGRQLRTNPALSAPAPQVDLSNVTPVTAFSGCSKATLGSNGVPVPAGPIVTDYSPELQQSGGPAIDGENIQWMPTGRLQPTADNTQYVNVGDVVEWTVETTTPNTDHPFHIHGASFQPIRMELNSGGNSTTLYTWDFTEYVDSIYVPTGHRLTFRFHAEDRNYVAEDDTVSPGGMVGRWLAHCHITKHAKRGMMMNFIAVDGCSLDQLQTADVMLRDTENDLGEEPSTGGLSASPDIIVRPDEVIGPNAAFGSGTGLENDANLGRIVEFGQDNYIYTRVTNRGNQPANASTDVYWSPASTLVTPDLWNFIGTTDTQQVPSGGFEVSDTLIWPEPDVPATGHYCFVGVTGSDTDPKPISPGIAASYPTFANFDDFRAFIRDNNNVVWRNFNVVDDVAMLTTGFSASFMFVGAFDRDREFDLVIRNPFEQVELQFMADEKLLKALSEQEIKFDVERRTARIFVPRTKELRLKGLLLQKGRQYRVKMATRETPENYIGEKVSIAQEHVAHYRKDYESLRGDEVAIKRELSQFKDHEANDLRNKLDAVQQQAIRLRQFIEVSKSDGRMEVGRVTWAFEKPREDGFKIKQTKRKEK